MFVRTYDRDTIIKMLKKRALEQIIRSFSNHRRIEILILLSDNPELSVTEISEKLKITEKLASFYTKKLTISGLIMKRSQGKNIRHKLTTRGKRILVFLRTLE
jgi:DNA-binding transcriptional ArsR family regulator